MKKISLRKSAQRFILRSEGINLNDLDVEDLAYKYLQQGKEIKKLKQQYSFENNSFMMYLHDGTPASINFTDVRGNGDMLVLFEVLFNLWRTKGRLYKGYIWVLVSKADLREQLAKKGRQDVTDAWIRNSLNNIRKFKINPSILKEYIVIGYYNRKAGVYPFGIKKA